MSTPEKFFGLIASVSLGAHSRRRRRLVNMLAADGNLVSIEPGLSNDVVEDEDLAGSRNGLQQQFDDFGINICLDNSVVCKVGLLGAKNA